MTSSAEASSAATDQDTAVDTTADLIAGWLGGAVGILVSNPLEVLKVRLQTSAPSSSSPPQLSSSINRVGRSSPAPSTTTALNASATAPAQQQHHHSSQQTRPGLRALYKAEGVRFLFAGAAGPILGLAFIDSAFFGLYGRLMQGLEQDRQDPSALSRVFLAGATAGGLCAMLETPIEVVKCRAQVESGAGAKLGSFKIASMIARKEGLRGFYIGGLMTAIHDGISSGIFFWSYFVFRRLLRGEQPFTATTVPQAKPNCTTTALPDSPPVEASLASNTAGKTFENGHVNKAEIGRILLAGGLAGALSAVIPYPFDIIKTRLQTFNFEARAPTPAATSTARTGMTAPSNSSTIPRSQSSPIPPTPPPIPHSHAQSSSAPARLSIRSVARGIHDESVSSFRYRYSTTWLYQFLSQRVFTNGGSTTSFINDRNSRASTTTPRRLIDGRPAPDPRAEKWALRLLGLKGFARGIRPTVISSFVGSAVTITTFEVALQLLGVEGGSGGGVG